MFPVLWQSEETPGVFLCLFWTLAGRTGENGQDSPLLFRFRVLHFKGIKWPPGAAEKGVVPW